MDESSEGGLWSSIRTFFGSGKTDDPIRKVITEARDNQELGADVATMLLNVLNLEEHKVQDAMIPRTDIDCVEESAPIQKVIEVIIESGHSRIPIYRENKDHIIGIVHAKDLLKILKAQDHQEDWSIASIMRTPLFIPETKNIKDMLLEFQSKKNHMAIAIDEYGGTSGLITFEDVLEEIVGEIEDEYDSPKPAEIKVLENESCLVSGRTSLEDLRNQLGIRLTSQFVETIGGYLTEWAGRVPQESESFSIDEYTFQIKEADNKQVFWVLIHPVPDVVQENLSE